MRRKPVILLSLVSLLLLLIGGAQVAYHLKSRKQVVSSEFPEVVAFLRQIPEGSGWTVTGESDGRRAVATGSSWLEGLGYGRTKEFHEHTYWLANSVSHRVANVKVYREDDHIVMVDVFASVPADGEEISKLLLGKFPHLQPVLKRYP